jgi:N-acetylmuramoyl-L-alanine amidase
MYGFKKALWMAALLAALVSVSSSAAVPGTGTGRVTRREPDAQRTLVIDAGHGGADGGAVSESGLRESEINLDIALRLYHLAGFLGERAVLTRASEDIEYSGDAVTVREKKRDDMRSRLRVIHAAKNAVLISVHQNKYDSPRPSGAQVIYAPDDDSRLLGETVQGALMEALGRGNRQGAARDDGGIYLLNNADCPAILVECGFLSNPAEEALLRTESHRVKLAMAIAGGVRR